MFNFPKFYMLCGLPASGKSHYALDLQRIMSNETNEKTVIVSSDNIRKELYGDENIQGNPEEVFNLVHERILQSLNNGVNVIYDATNLKRKYRLEKDLVPIIQKYIDDNHAENYMENFVGGANIIDKINCKNRYGSDIHKYLIALLKQAQRDNSVFPNTISKEEYYKVKKS